MPDQNLRHSVNELAKYKDIKVHHVPVFLNMSNETDRAEYARLMNEVERKERILDNIEQKWQSSQIETTFNIVLFTSKMEKVLADKDDEDTLSSYEKSSLERQKAAAERRKKVDAALDKHNAEAYDGETDPDDLLVPGELV